MATNLIEVANALFTPDVVSKISSLIGETPAKTSQALGTVVPRRSVEAVQPDFEHQVP